MKIRDRRYWYKNIPESPVSQYACLVSEAKREERVCGIVMEVTNGNHSSGSRGDLSASLL